MQKEQKRSAIKLWQSLVWSRARMQNDASSARLWLRSFFRLSLRWSLVGGFVSGMMGVSAIATQAQPTRLPAGDPQQVPTARYGRGEAVDLSLIVEEWRDRYPAIPIYACNCNADTCGDVSVWPFRDFTRYQSFVALGAFNATNSEETGFNCFDMETGERPE